MNALPPNFRRPPRDPAKIADALARIDEETGRNYAKLYEKRTNTENGNDDGVAKYGTME